jgi:DNA-binding transcriptional regulator YdaS (Cro superfamily)
MMISIIRRASSEYGGVGKLATALGCSRQALYQWTEVPRGRVLEIEEMTGIDRSEMRPDIWPVLELE